MDPGEEISCASRACSGQNDEVADLLWDDVKCFFDPRLMGSLPDVIVPEASVEDWQAVLDLVSSVHSVPAGRDSTASA